MIRAFLALIVVIALAGCNTIRGAGRDVAYAAVDAGLPLLPLPLPQPSARRNLDRAVFGGPQTLGDVERRLRGKLTTRGYEDNSYYRVPGGFALVTSLERIGDGGSAYPAPQRFALEAASLCRLRFNWSNPLDCLLNADPGRYRMIVFLVTTAVQTTDGDAASFAEVQSWVAGGGDFLPQSLAQQALTPQHNISAAVYEFARPSVSASPRQVTTLSALAHLRAAGLVS